MRFIFEKRMFFLLILAKSLENAHNLPMTLEFQRSQLYHNKRLQGTTTVPHARNLTFTLYHNERLQGTTTYYVLCYIIKALLSYRVLSRSCVVFLLLPVYLRRCYSHLTL